MSRSNLAINYEPYHLTDKNRADQTKMIMKLFGLWGLSNKEMALTLGLSPNTETSIHRYKNNKQYLPLYRDIQDRVGHLLAIHKYLRRVYGLHQELVYQWIKTPNADFNAQSPIQVICREGYLGLVKVRSYLEAHQQ